MIAATMSLATRHRPAQTARPKPTAAKAYPTAAKALSDRSKGLSDLAGLACPVRCPELAFEQTARSGPRQRGREGDGPRNLVAGQVLARERGDLLAGQRRSGQAHHGRVHGL